MDRELGDLAEGGGEDPFYVEGGSFLIRQDGLRENPFYIEKRGWNGNPY